MSMMNDERFKKINDIIDGKSVRLREKYVQKNYNTIYSDIINYCSNINDLPFIQKIWHYVNDVPNYFLCTCGNKTTFNRNWLDGYRRSCSAKCAQKDEDVKLKRSKTNLEKYGVENVAKLDKNKKKQEETNLKKYGSKSSFQNKNVQDKWKANIKEKYGADHIFQTSVFCCHGSECTGRYQCGRHNKTLEDRIQRHIRRRPGYSQR